MSDRRAGSTLLRITLLALSVPATLAAQNLIPANPEFDGFGTSGFPNDPFPGWNSIGLPSAGGDADSCPDSDSHRTTANSSTTGARTLGCVPVSPGETLHLEVTYRSTGLVDVRVTESFDSACTSFPIGDPPPPPAIPASVEWTTVRVQHVVAAGKDGVLFSLRAAADGAYITDFDRAYLGRAERIFADDLEGGSFCRWDEVVSTADV